MKLKLEHWPDYVLPACLALAWGWTVAACLLGASLGMDDHGMSARALVVTSIICYIAWVHSLIGEKNKFRLLLSCAVVGLLWIIK